jgi:hypothetical protein
VRELKPCGTLSAYKRHLYRGEKPCDACKAANTERRQDPYAAEMNRALEKNPPVIEWVPNGRGVLVAAHIADPHTKKPRKQVAA